MTSGRVQEFLLLLTDVDVRPLVEILHNALDAAEDALGNAGKDPRVIVVSSRVGDGSECLNDGHQERSKANGSETGRDGSNEGVADCLGAAPGLVRCHPLLLGGCNATQRNAIQWNKKKGIELEHSIALKRQIAKIVIMIIAMYR